jgi:D-beta-D-heptose 7-phosphate kinase/D-beta-D-heptose 1-phosphate adenosyltransferase
LTREDLAPIVRVRQERGEKGVFTNGCFDILHVGHVRSLQEARNKGDFLIVGLNSDSSVRRLKGPTRPINDENTRAEMLAALACVDYVVLFAERTASELVAFLQPAIYAKSEVYRQLPLPERADVEAYGGRVEFLKDVPGLSTTAFIQRLRSLPEEER